MDKRGAIGILDTGVGGLTAVRELRALLPGEDLVFFSDTARVPYGGKSAGEIRRLTADCAARLAGEGVKLILVACGTITATALDVAEEKAGVPALGVIAPAAAEAARVSSSGRIGVLSTVATARSGAFERALLELRPDARLLSHGAAGLVPLVEAGRVSPDDPEVAAAVKTALEPFSGFDMDTLILGCTHFPLLASAFAAQLPGVALINSGAAGARACAAELAARGLLSGRDSGGGLRCIVTGDRAAFNERAALFLGI